MNNEIEKLKFTICELENLKNKLLEIDCLHTDMSIFLSIHNVIKKLECLCGALIRKTRNGSKLNSNDMERLIALESMNNDLVKVAFNDMDKHCALYDFCLGKKLSTIYTREMHAYQTVMDYLKSNFIEIKDYADDKE